LTIGAEILKRGVELRETIGDCGLKKRNSWKVWRGCAENVIWKKGSKFFSSFAKRIFFGRGKKSLWASNFNLRQATRLPYNTDNRQPRTDNETRSRIKARWASKFNLRQATRLRYNTDNR